VAAAFGIDRYINPYKVPHKSPYRYNWSFESKYKKLGELGGGANGIVVKCVRRDDPTGKEYAAKLSRHG
jgi:serine/threonine protein kinase